MEFTDFALDVRLQRAVKSAGYTVPTPIQDAVIPLALTGRDMIGTAPTGTGKTAAFVLPILHSLLARPARTTHTRALVVSPTRELAEQTRAAIQQLGKFTGLTSATVYGGVAMQPQERALRRGVDIIVACPGRLLDHIDRRTASLSGIEFLVLDEADRMLDMGFLPSIKRILAELPRERQTMLFSATFAPELNHLAARALRNPVRVDKGEAVPASTITHALCLVPRRLKTALLLKILGEVDTQSVLIFTRTKHRADRLARQIRQAGYKSATIHSNKSRSQRQRALDGFRSGEFPLLVATDIAARGLDIAAISHVINYDIPDCADTYIHRIGRTGRAEHTGEALTLVSVEDASAVREIERSLGQRIETREFAGFDYGAPPRAIDAAPPRRGAHAVTQAPRRPTAGAAHSRSAAGHAFRSRKVAH